MSSSLASPFNLQSHWRSVETAAQRKGRTPSRSQWRIAREVYVAPTTEEARDQALNHGMGAAWLGASRLTRTTARLVRRRSLSAPWFWQTATWAGVRLGRSGPRPSRPPRGRSPPPARRSEPLVYREGSEARLAHKAIEIGEDLRPPGLRLSSLAAQEPQDAISVAVEDHGQLVEISSRARLALSPGTQLAVVHLDVIAPALIEHAAEQEGRNTSLV